MSKVARQGERPIDYCVSAIKGLSFIIILNCRSN